MKKKLAAFTTVLALIGMVGMANAALTTIGTASYSGSDYNLIWDDDNNGNSVVWLDFSNFANWAGQKSWTAGLNTLGTLTYNIDSAYTVDWGSNSWRLPTADILNSTNSEMQQLYTALGNPNTPMITGDFSNLISADYWTGTANASNPTFSAWRFHMWGDGGQSTSALTNSYRGLAIRTGQVSAVPVPGAIWLLGSGIIGLAALRRR